MRFLRAHYRLGFVVLLGILALAMMVPIVMRSLVDRYITTTIAGVPQTEVALVLGASVYRGKPSPVLAERADTAIALYRKGKVGKILVTGDNGALSYDEVTPVRKYLLGAGVASQDIFLDHAGFDTYSSMYRAREVFLAHSLTVVTQDFHLPRALWIARHLGIEAYGVVAEGGEHSPYDYVREIPASIKAILNVMTERQPKYLGPTIPLSGNGEETWY
ncbi:YdcF family protein [Candidatus Kaiserbacteria bacterium]|nr:YdcF family protein [Candidatus Kaiserbacteria bacterium]